MPSRGLPEAAAGNRDLGTVFGLAAQAAAPAAGGFGCPAARPERARPIRTGVVVVRARRTSACAGSVPRPV
ncbi:hypothetical protein [Nocardia thraciensis]